MRFSTTMVLALSAALLGVAAPSHAQPGQIGVIGGATFTSLRGVDNVDARSGLAGGAYLVVPFAGPLQWQFEGLLVNRRAEPRGLSRSGTLELSYAELPVMLRLSVAPRSSLNPHVYAGPYLGLRINCSIGDENDCDNLPGLSTKTVDVGGVAGGGVAMDVGGLVLTGGLRYAFGVSTLAEFERESVREASKNGTFLLYAGLGIRLGSR